MPGDANKPSKSPETVTESPASSSKHANRTTTSGSARKDSAGRTSVKPLTPSTKDVPPQYKKRGLATPNSMVVLHRKGYVLDVATTLGSGAYAKVKMGSSLKMNVQVAIKIVNKLSTPKEVIERFLPREIETMQTVSNDHIIRLHEVIDTSETLFFILELADRGDLLDFINERKYLSERLARGFFSDLVKGMDHCHSKGVVHRDLKCENLLLDSHMRLKISDFGFARKFDGNLRTFCGSFAYAAPEVILGNPYDGPLADIWSMGVILYAMVTGRLPFKDTSTSVLMADIAAGVKFSSRHTEKLKSIVCKILKFLPQERSDMRCIQSHPWMNVPLSFNFPPSSSPTGSAEKLATLPDPPKSKNVVEPPTFSKLKEKGGSVDSQSSSKTSSDAQPETLCVPFKMKSGRDARKNSLPPDDAAIIDKFANSRRRRTVPELFPDSTLLDSLRASKKGDTSAELEESRRDDSVSAISNISSSASPSKILDTRTAFHSASRYEKGS